MVPGGSPRLPTPRAAGATGAALAATATGGVTGEVVLHWGPCGACKAWEPWLAPSCWIRLRQLPSSCWLYEPAPPATTPTPAEPALVAAAGVAAAAAVAAVAAATIALLLLLTLPPLVTSLLTRGQGPVSGGAGEFLGGVGGVGDRLMGAGASEQAVGAA